MPDLLQSIDNIKQGMIDPSNQSLTEKRWYDNPIPNFFGFPRSIAETIGPASPRTAPQEGVKAIPFASPADPISQLAFYLISMAFPGKLVGEPDYYRLKTGQ